jgi:N-acyl-D-aspartate/D-glutamate deacylase
VAVQGGTIVAVTTRPLRGRDTLNARGLVVAPGFIDLHQHAQDSLGYTVMVRDGTTSALELEGGTANVAAWYAARVGRAAVHHGVAVGHAFVRARVLGDSTGSEESAPTGAGAHRAATDAEISAIRRGVAEGLGQGAVAVGLLLGYTPAASPWEVLQVFHAAAASRASVHVHVRDLPEPLWYLEVAEVVGAAASTGAGAQIVHVNSSMQEQAPSVIELLRGARARGVDVTTEAYPYAAAMTEIESAIFDDWATWRDAKFARFEWPATGERLTRATFERYRAIGGNVIIHPSDSAAAEGWIRAVLADPLPMIASDGVLHEGQGHPRTAGTHARILGRYVREAKVLTLMDAIRRMTLEPARRLERRVPAMRLKGRVRPGADADLVIFDPATVLDQATFREPARPSSGIPFVIVGGSVVVRQGALVPGVLRGRPIRAPVDAR